MVEKASTEQEFPIDRRRHVQSMLMRESLLDKQVMTSTETPVVPMLPFCHVIKIGGRSILDNGKKAVYPLVEVLGRLLENFKLVIGTGGGVRSRHVTSIGMDLGLPTGVLAQLCIIDALGNAHMLGTLLAPFGVVAIPPEILGHMLPFFIKSAPGVICNGDPPFSIWEQPPRLGRIPPHRTDAGTFLLAECYGCATHTLVKDVNGLYESDPKLNPDAKFIGEITVSDLRRRNLPTLPFDRVLLDLLANARQVESFQIINGLRPELLERALRGEHVGTIVRKD
ncbi:uridylate kinase [Bradyrhizobium centrolobii]|uniref:Uridylate kinase n=1 Tax=Bradyrhizobium centrolobii TaxID=1505087 RepID=A0A176YGL5_9BRAD|nr:uridylate kinase [Bradyrhizobium centrolobii]OAF05782.1 uridylate kinase [Bradyrhizobium centrolobii]